MLLPIRDRQHAIESSSSAFVRLCVLACMRACVCVCAVRACCNSLESPLTETHSMHLCHFVRFAVHVWENWLRRLSGVKRVEMENERPKRRSCN